MLKLYHHPFASFCQKALIAFYEKEVAFEAAFIDLGNPDHREQLRSVWPMMKFPVLKDEASGRIYPESSVIIEFLDFYSEAGPRLVPDDREQALRVRIWDRFFDSFVAMNVTKIVVDRLRPEGRTDPEGVAQAEGAIRQAYDVIEAEIGDCDWIAGDAFSLADCAAAPALFYAGVVAPQDQHPKLRAYRDRLEARPSFRRVLEEARPYRTLLPVPWPASYQ